MNPSRSHPGRGRGCYDPHEGEGVVVYFGEPIRSGYALIRPLSDYGQDGAAILYKAWVCDSPTCSHNLRISSKAASIRLRQWQGCAAVAFPPHAPDAVRTTRGVRCSPKQGRSRGRRSRVPS